MPVSVSLRRWAAALAIAAPLALPTTAAAADGAEIRVITSSGKVLAENEQLTGTVQIKTDPKADCLGPGSGGSGDRVRVPGATALGAVVDAAKLDRDVRPVSVTDYYDFGLGVCGFGGNQAGGSSFWYLLHNHAAAQLGGDQLRVQEGDEVVWWLDPDFGDAPPEELELKAPARAGAGEPFTVKVLEHSSEGERNPAQGAQVTGASELTDSNGITTVTLPEDERRLLQATRGSDIPSNSEPVCVNGELSECPKHAGTKVFGHDGEDRTDGSPGPDLIKTAGGEDVVRVRDGEVDRVSCGGGHDKVIADRKDEVAENCERVEKA